MIFATLSTRATTELRNSQTNIMQAAAKITGKLSCTLHIVDGGMIYLQRVMDLFIGAHRYIAKTETDHQKTIRMISNHQKLLNSSLHDYSPATYTFQPLDKNYELYSLDFFNSLYLKCMPHMIATKTKIIFVFICK